MPNQTSTNLPYLIAVVIMALIGVAGVLTVFHMRPDADNTAIVATLAGFIVPTTLSLLAFMKAQETHIIVNSRMDEYRAQLQLVAQSAERAARSEGYSQGQQVTTEAADGQVDRILAHIDQQSNRLAVDIKENTSISTNAFTEANHVNLKLQSLGLANNAIQAANVQRNQQRDAVSDARAAGDAGRAQQQTALTEALDANTAAMKRAEPPPRRRSTDV